MLEILPVVLLFITLIYDIMFYSRLNGPPEYSKTGVLEDWLISGLLCLSICFLWFCMIFSLKFCYLLDCITEFTYRWMVILLCSIDCGLLTSCKRTGGCCELFKLLFSITSVLRLYSGFDLSELIGWVEFLAFCIYPRLYALDWDGRLFELTFTLWLAWGYSSFGTYEWLKYDL